MSRVTWKNLSEDVEATFKNLEGCGRHDQLLGNEATSLHVGKDSATASQKYRGSERGKATIAKRRAHDTARVGLNKWRRNMKRRIDEWESAAKMKCIGRGLHPEEWFRILTDPTGEDEIAAQVDFIFFLRFRRVTRTQVASMLRVNVGYVDLQLSFRKAIANEKSRAA